MRLVTRFFLTTPSRTWASNLVTGQTEYPGLPGLTTGTGSLSQTIISNFVTTILDPVGASPTVTFL
jgi:hypothetical protein